ncbi:MAG: sensor histidine kinase [Candidatus Binatia bacterium]
MEKLIAQFRFAAVLLTGAVLLDAYEQLGTAAGRGPVMAAAWSGALLYAVALLLAEPYRRVPLVAWQVVSGLIDWGLITLAIVATGMERSDLYVLYFLSVMSIALRFELGEVIGVGVGTVAVYVGLTLATATDWTAAAQTAGTRMGYVLLFSVVSGVLAREAKRLLRERVNGEARRRAVEEVTATVSHDLRNPLAAITGLVEILLDAAPEMLSFDQRALLHRISANAQQMSNLVNNLVDAELIERGQQAFRPAPVDLNGLVRHVVEAQAHQAEVKQIGLVLDLSPRLPPANLDRGMVERLISNLLHNAVKFTPENGAIRVSTRRREARVDIEVWNSGAHVPPELRAMMFEKFVREADSRGVGLGLYICKSIVALHGGTIAVRNAPGGGVAVIAEFPMASDALTRTPAPTPAWQPQQRAGALARWEVFSDE